MNFGRLHQDCIEKVKEKHVPRLARTEGEIGIDGLWCMQTAGQWQRSNRHIYLFISLFTLLFKWPWRQRPIETSYLFEKVAGYFFKTNFRHVITYWIFVQVAGYFSEILRAGAFWFGYIIFKHRTFMIEVINFYFITDREQNQELSTIRCRKHGSKKWSFPCCMGQQNSV